MSSQELHRSRRHWVPVIIIIALAAVFVRLLDSAAFIESYRVIDDHTIAVQTVSGPGTWTRVTGVTESASSVTVSVSSLRAPLLAGTGDDLVDLTVTLRDPLGGRQVIDASTGLAAPRARN